MHVWDTATKQTTLREYKYEASRASGKEERYETKAGSGSADRLLPSAKDKSRIG